MSGPHLRDPTGSVVLEAMAAQRACTATLRCLSEPGAGND
jgi:hypothetical protein